MPRVGQPAPSFALSCTGPARTADREASLADYAGHWLALVFYPRDFTTVCPTELLAFSGRVDDFAERDCSLLAISVDSMESHRAWLRTAVSDGGIAGLRLPLAADPGGIVARRYDVLNEDEQAAERGLFIIDPNGVLQYQVIHNLRVGRSTDETLRVLDAIQSGGLCPPSWVRGDGTIDPGFGLAPGRLWRHYRLESLLGKGGFGWVYRARDLILDRSVAVKVGSAALRCAREGIMQEARAAARLSHPNVCAILAVDEADGAPMIVMQLLPGGSLQARLRSARPSAGEALAISRQMIAGLRASHRAGVVHGDIKPANILFAEDGTAVVADFGLARPLAPSQKAPKPEPTQGDGSATTAEQAGSAVPATQTQTRIVGTPSYMAPERTYGAPPSLSGDVYSLALVIYELFSGGKAIRADSAAQALLKARKLDPAGLRTAVPAMYRDCFVRMLAAEPEQRPSMDDVAATFEEGHEPC